MDELPILQALRERQRYRTLIAAVPRDSIGQEATLLLDWFALYFQAYPDHQHVDLDALMSLIKLRNCYDKEQMVTVAHLVNLLRKPIDQAAVKGIVGTLHELDLAGRAQSILLKYKDGDEIDITYELGRLANETLRAVNRSSPASWIDDPIEEILEREAGDFGLKFPTHVLRDHIKGVLGGANIALGARPDKGKTSLLAFVLTHFATQLEKFFEPERPILWLNNEGSGKRIIPRVYQAALGKTYDEIVTLSNDGKLAAAYTKRIGRADRIRVKDMHGASLAQIEQVVESMRPCVVAFDMLANFRLAGAASGGNKADEVEQKWQEVREMAVRHDFVAISTVQVSADGDNMLYPPYSALKDSKTGIQGATDLILIMGALNDPQYQSLRGISTAKNKYQMPGKPSHVESQLVFDPERCLFSDGG